MVLPPPPAPAEGARWLRRLRRSLTLGGGKVLINLRAAGPEHLRPVADLMASLGPTRICLRFNELREARLDDFVLVVLRPHEFAEANFARPVFRERRLRAVLLMSDEHFVLAREKAPDLLDWASATVEAEPVVPGFVVESLRLLTHHFPGMGWEGSAADALAALQATFPGQPHREAPSSQTYGALVEALSDTRGWRIVPVSNEAQALRLRIALAESRRRGRVLAVGFPVPGWPTLNPTVASWAELEAAGLNGAQAADIDCEAAALDLPPTPSEESRLDALSGRGPLPLLRAVLASDDLTALRRRQVRQAAKALREHRVEDIHHIAAHADRAPLAVPADLLPRLAAAALPGAIRSGSAPTAVGVAEQMRWYDLVERWTPFDTRSATLRRRANALLHEGRYAEAEERLRQALAVCGADRGTQHSEYDALMHDLAAVLERQGRFDEAEALLRQVLASDERAGRTTQPAYGVSLGALARTLEWQGRYREAEEHLRRALAVIEKTLGLEHRDHTAMLHVLGRVLEKEGRYEEAEQYQRQALETFGRTLGADHPDNSIVLLDLAKMLENQGRYNEAEALLRRAAAIRENSLGVGHPEQAALQHALASVLAKQDRYEEAESALRRSQALLEATVGPDHANYASSLHELARLLAARGQYGDAEAMLRRALALKERIGRDHPSYAASLGALGEVLLAQGKYQEAEILLRESLTTSQASLGMDHPRSIPTLNNLAVSFAHQGRVQEALPLAEQAVALQRRIHGELHPETGQILFVLGQFQRHLGHPEAQATLARALEILEHTLGPAHSITRQARALVSPSS